MTFLGRETGSLIRKGPAFYFLGKLGLFSCLQTCMRVFAASVWERGYTNPA